MTKITLVGAGSTSFGVGMLLDLIAYADELRGSSVTLADVNAESLELMLGVAQGLNTIGKRTVRKGGATVRANGAITLILSYKSSRTLVFRYTNPDGRRTQVKLKIKVVKKPR